ncbi:IPTL-CTERM sorting domain-containing protein [Comamonas odontotermitis]|uniref:IPTL-CTERM sorting domain-containing protein n=1 Tax=Comamonas odontotermitis TaxID=379895 RepID=UPI003751E7BC
MNAAPDTGNGTVGTASTPIANVLANDIVVTGAPATTSNSTLTVVTPASNAGVVLDPATGAVTTTAAVLPGIYTITYQLCDKTVPTVCATSTATVTVTGGAGPQPDTGNATAGTASTSIANVLANDIVDGVPATPSNSTLTVVTPASNAGVVLDPATGAVTTTAAVPPGTYTITYQLCDKATPAVCATSTATVTVAAPRPTGDGVTKVPTLSEYGLMMLSGLLAALGLPLLRRRKNRDLNGDPS